MNNETIFTIIKLAAGPIIGSVIGYFTNLIAVKMLFYPHKEVKLFGKPLPFTPGVIPKGQPRLAKAIGKAVAENLITKEDLEKKVLSDDVTNGIASEISQKLEMPIKKAILEISNIPENIYDDGKDKLSIFVSSEVTKSLSTVDYSKLLKEKGTPLILDSITNPMIRMFVNEDLINSFIEPLGIKIKEMIQSDGNDFIKPLVSKKLDEIDSQSTVKLLSKMDISSEMLNNAIVAILKTAISQGVSKIFEKIDIKEMVESKINEMDINELEKLILEVMNKELKAIVNLGALIGLILGLVNMGISMLGK